MSGISWRVTFRATARGATSAEIPRMSSTLQMLLPTTLPKARPGSPASAERTVTASSGELVPIATTVSPTTSGESPKASARPEAPLTRSEAPGTRQARPAATSPRLVASNPPAAPAAVAAFAAAPAAAAAVASIARTSPLQGRSP